MSEAATTDLPNAWRKLESLAAEVPMMPPPLNDNECLLVKNIKAALEKQIQTTEPRHQNTDGKFIGFIYEVVVPRPVNVNPSKVAARVEYELKELAPAASRTLQVACITFLGDQVDVGLYLRHPFFAI